MKKKLLLLSFLAMSLVILQSSINGVTNSQQLDRTNSPFTAGNCAACHSGGSFESNMTVELIDKADQKVGTYIGGETYTIRYTINATGAAKYGIQSTILAADSTDAGTLTAKSANTQTSILANKTYLDQKTASTSNVFEANWTAPSINKGDINIYTSGLAANGNSAATGDKFISADPFVLKPTLIGINGPSLSLNIYPNPTFDKLTIESQSTAKFIEIYNIRGQLQLRINNSNAINTNTLNSGIYIIKVNMDNQVFQQKILKN
jgi:hypothetical protein